MPSENDMILPVAKTDALQEDIADFGLDVIGVEEVGDLLCSHEALRATVAALTAENERLRADERAATATLKDVNAALERMIRQCADAAALPSSRETTDG